jgi:hypothetical protein
VSSVLLLSQTMVFAGDPVDRGVDRTLTTLILGFVIAASVLALVALMVGMELSQREEKSEKVVHQWAKESLSHLKPRLDAMDKQWWSDERMRVYLMGMVELQRSVPPLVRSAQPRPRSIASFLVAGLATISLAVFAVVLAIQLAPQGAETAEDPGAETDEDPGAEALAQGWGQGESAPAMTSQTKRF